MIRIARMPTLAALIASTAAAAADTTVTFANAPTPVTIPLLPGARVRFAANGNLTAQCALDGASRCVGLPAAAPPPLPVVALSYDGPATVFQNTSVTLAAAVTNAAACVRKLDAASAAGATGWSGAAPGSSAAGGSVVLTQVGTYKLQLECFNDGGSATSSTISITTVPPQETIACGGTTIAAPAGFVRDTTRDEWHEIFPGTFPPLSGGDAVPVFIARGKYLSVQFTMPTGAAGSVLRIRSAASGGAPAPVPGGVFFNISRCPLDFRTAANYPNPVASDPNTWAGCRNWRAATAYPEIRYKLTPNIANQYSECQLQPGATYYINMIMASPLDGGFTPGEHSCGAGDANTQCGFELEAM